ncbi:CD99 antigen [Gastrophryne carolinensis]
MIVKKGPCHLPNIHVSVDLDGGILEKGCSGSIIKTIKMIFCRLSHQPDFDLGDAIGGEDKNPTEKPRPAQPGQVDEAGGSFGDDDLADAAGGMPPRDPDGRRTNPHAGGEEGGQDQGEEKQSVIAGVLSALGVAAVGAVSSFIAYQKKKLCFKGQADDPENVNMDNQKGDQHDPQVQSSLLAK